MRKLPLWLRCLAVFILSLGSDVIAAWHLRALVRDQTGPAMLSVFLLQFVNLIGLVFVVDDKTWRGRFCLTATTATAAAIGTYLVILWSI